MSIVRGLCRLRTLGRWDRLRSIGQAGELSGRRWSKGGGEHAGVSTLRRNVASTVQENEESESTVKPKSEVESPIPIEMAVQSAAVGGSKPNNRNVSGTRGRAEEKTEDVGIGSGGEKNRTDEVESKRSVSVSVAEQSGNNAPPLSADSAKVGGPNAIISGDARENIPQSSQADRRGEHIVEGEKVGRQNPANHNRARQTLKVYWQDLTRRKGMSEKMTALWQDAAFRELMGGKGKTNKRRRSLPAQRRRERTPKKMKATWQDTPHRKRMSEKMKVFWQDPAHRKRVSEKLKAFWQNPSHRKHMSETKKVLWQDPEFRKRMSDKRKTMWQDPAYRDQIKESVKTKWQDPAYRKRIADKVKEKWRDPIYRDRMSEIRRTMWLDPTYRKYMSEKVRAMWNDPVTKIVQQNDACRPSSIETPSHFSDSDVPQPSKLTVPVKLQSDQPA